jgi:hypothetical protein
MSEYLEKWLKYLNVNQVDDSTFDFFDFRIYLDYKIYQGGKCCEKIAVYDINKDCIIHLYDINKITNLLVPRVYGGLKNEKMLLKALIKVIADAPTFYRKQKESKNFDEAVNSKYLNFFNKSLIIENFSVYMMYYETEKMVRYRVGKDDTYDIIQKTEWYVTYNDSIIETEYLRSLLPDSIINQYSEDVYGPSVIYGDTKKFQIDIEETLKFRNAIDINAFFEI